MQDRFFCVFISDRILSNPFLAFRVWFKFCSNNCIQTEHRGYSASIISALQKFSIVGVQPLKADRHEATLPRNYCRSLCYATYAMCNHGVQRLHGKRCTPRLRGKVAPCRSALTVLPSQSLLRERSERSFFFKCTWQKFVEIRSGLKQFGPTVRFS